MRNLLGLFLCLTVLSCGVKDAPPANTQQPLSLPSGTIEGVLVSKDKKFLVKPSTMDFIEEPQFKVSYQVVTKDLEPLPETVNFNVHYWMPNMPTMPVTPPIIEKTAPGKYVVTYDISMDGKWEFTLGLTENEKGGDSVNWTYEVPALQ